MESKLPDTRRAVLAAIERSAQQSPILINSIIRESLHTLLSKEPANDAKNVGEEAESSSSKSGRLPTVLYHCVSFDDSFDVSDREKVLVELIVLSHHHLAGETLFQSVIRSNNRNGPSFNITADLDCVVSED